MQGCNVRVIGEDKVGEALYVFGKRLRLAGRSLHVRFELRNSPNRRCILRCRPLP